MHTHTHTHGRGAGSHPHTDLRPEVASCALQVWRQLRLSRLLHAAHVVGPSLELIHSSCPQVVRLARTMALDVARTELSVRGSLQTVREW